MSASCADLQELDRLILTHQHSAAIMLGLKMLQQGMDYQVIEDELCFSLTTFTSQFIASEGHGNNEKAQKAEWLWRKSLDMCQWKSDVLLHAYAKFKCAINDTLQGIDLLQIRVAQSPLTSISLPLIESLENMKALVADQWHYRMLNDMERNEVYDRAIRRAMQLRPGAVVLDIGGGTGLLSMFAARAGAKHVYCCEMSKPMAEIATRCIRRNGYSERITVLQKHSRDLVVGQGGDLPARVGVIVTELVDSGLLGEHILATLRHAREHLLVKNEGGKGGIVIPHLAAVSGVAVSSRALSARQSLLAPPSSPEGGGGKRPGSATGDQQQFPWSREQHRFLSKQNLQLGIDESYTCEALAASGLTGLRHTKLTEIFPIGTVFFDGRKPPECNLTLSVPTIASGSVDAIAYWFEMQLLDPVHCRREGEEDGETFVVSTAPGRAYNSWDQALVFTAKTQRQAGTRSNSTSTYGGTFEDAACHSVRGGDSLHVRCSIREDCIVMDVATPPTTAHTTTAVGITTAAAAIIPVGEMDFAALNDFNVTEAYMSSLQRCLTKHAPPIYPQHTALRVLELTSSWTSFAVNYMQYMQNTHEYALRSRTENQFSGMHALVVCASRQHKDYIEECARSYQRLSCAEGESACPAEVYFWTGSLVEEFSRASSFSQQQQRQHQEKPTAVAASIYNNIITDCEVGRGFDVLVCDLVEGSGMLRQGVLAEITFALQCMMATIHSSPPLAASACSLSLHASLKQRVIPCSLGVVLSLLESHSLFSQFRIDSSRTVQIDVGSELDKYKVMILRELDLQGALPFPLSGGASSRGENGKAESATSGGKSRFLSGEIEVLELPLVEALLSSERWPRSSEKSHKEVSEDAMEEESEGEDEEEEEDIISSEVYRLPVLCSGIVHCVALWHRVYMAADCGEVLYTGPHREGEGEDEEEGRAVAHWRQVGFLLETPLTVQRGDEVAVRLVVHRASGMHLQLVGGEVKGKQ